MFLHKSYHRAFLQCFSTTNSTRLLLPCSSSSQRPELPSSSHQHEKKQIADVQEFGNFAQTEDVQGCDDQKPLPRSHPLLAMQSRRRTLGSPILALNAVAISRSIQDSVDKLVEASKLRQQRLKARSRILQITRAVETYKKLKRPVQRGPPVVLPAPEYTSDRALAFLCTRFPGTFAANVFVLSEIRRILPRFAPTSVLDFGAGVGTSVLAAAHVLDTPAIAKHAQQNARHSEDDLAHCIPRMSIKHAWLIDNAPAMKPLASALMAAEDSVKSINVLQTNSLDDGPTSSCLYDLVIASFSLTEFVRKMMIEPDDDALREVQPITNNPRARVEKASEVCMRRLIRTLWKRTAPGGQLVVIDDGTAAGFEVVLFARELLLNEFPGPELEDHQNHAKKYDCSDPKEYARVIAPCVHSHKCPLDGHVTRRRMCRFEQRLNRPPFQRNAYPQHNAFEDEFFSFIVLQKLTHVEELQDNVHEYSWGRLIRAPLRRPKQISIDSCTREATLERRVVSKRSAPDGYFARARRSRWGDIWPVPPSNKKLPVNF